MNKFFLGAQVTCSKVEITYEEKRKTGGFSGAVCLAHSKKSYKNTVLKIAVLSNFLFRFLNWVISSECIKLS